jgi:hypothetical protein
MTTSHRPPATKSSNPRRPAARSSSNGKPRRARSATRNQTEQLIFTIQAKTGEFVRAEKVDRAGTRSEISRSIARTIARKHRLEMIESVLDEAFEAGISSVIEPGSDDEASEDPSEEEAEVRKLLLDFIISPEVRDHVRRRMINRLMLDQAIIH